MIHRFPRQIKYTAAALLFQFPAIAQDAPEPKPRPEWSPTELAAICGDKGWSIETASGNRVRLVDGAGEVVKTATDLEVFNGWLRACQKKGEQ